MKTLDLFLAGWIRQMLAHEHGLLNALVLKQQRQRHKFKFSGVKTIDLPFAGLIWQGWHPSVVLFVGMLSCWRLVLYMFKCRLCGFTGCMGSMPPLSGICCHFVIQFCHRCLGHRLYKVWLCSLERRRGWEDDTAII